MTVVRAVLFSGFFVVNCGERSLHWIGNSCFCFVFSRNHGFIFLFCRCSSNCVLLWVVYFCFTISCRFCCLINLGSLRAPIGSREGLGDLYIGVASLYPASTVLPRILWMVELCYVLHSYDWLDGHFLFSFRWLYSD